jgi:hypothetical protein
MLPVCANTVISLNVITVAVSIAVTAHFGRFLPGLGPFARAAFFSVKVEMIVPATAIRIPNAESAERQLSVRCSSHTAAMRKTLLKFVRRTLGYCSATTSAPADLPLPSLGVSSLDLGRLQWRPFFIPPRRGAKTCPGSRETTGRQAWPYRAQAGHSPVFFAGLPHRGTARG